jgi:hypothetical protein
LIQISNLDSSESDTLYLSGIFSKILLLLVIVAEIIIPYMLTSNFYVGIPTSSFNYFSMAGIRIGTVFLFVLFNTFIYFVLKGIFQKNFLELMATAKALLFSKLAMYLLGLSLILGLIGPLGGVSEFYARKLNCLSRKSVSNFVRTVAKTESQRWFFMASSVLKEIETRNIFIESS